MLFYITQVYNIKKRIDERYFLTIVDILKVHTALCQYVSFILSMAVCYASTSLK